MSAEAAGKPTLKKMLDAASLEVTAFERAGQAILARSTWDEARRASERARRDCWKWLAAEYGARNPHWGWASFVLLAAGISAAIAGVLSTGFRIDPADTIMQATVLSVVAAAGVLVVSLASGGRPQGRGFFRVYLVVAIGLAAAAAFQLSRGSTPLAWMVAASAVIGVAAFAGYLIARGANPAGAEEIDTAIGAALLRMQPEVDATAARMQAEVVAQLTPDQQHAILAQRGSLVSESIATASTPPGGVIIRVILATWIPEGMREDIAKGS